MTLVILPKEGAPPPAVGAPCTGTQYYGPADWNDPGGLWNGTTYVWPMSSPAGQLDRNGTWAVGYRPSICRVTYTLAPGYFFDNHTFELKDGVAQVIGTVSPSNGVGTFTADMVLTFAGAIAPYDIYTFVGTSYGYNGTLSVDGICFDPV